MFGAKAVAIGAAEHVGRRGTAHYHVLSRNYTTLSHLAVLQEIAVVGRPRQRLSVSIGIEMLVFMAIDVVSGRSRRAKGLLIDGGIDNYFFGMVAIAIR